MNLKYLKENYLKIIGILFALYIFYNIFFREKENFSIKKIGKSVNKGISSVGKSVASLGDIDQTIDDLETLVSKNPTTAAIKGLEKFLEEYIAMIKKVNNELAKIKKINSKELAQSFDKLDEATLEAEEEVTF